MDEVKVMSLKVSEGYVVQLRIVCKVELRVESSIGFEEEEGKIYKPAFIFPFFLNFSLK